MCLFGGSQVHDPPKDGPARCAAASRFVNAATLHGAKTKSVECFLPPSKSFVEKVVEGDRGLLGQVKRLLLPSSDDDGEIQTDLQKALQDFGGVLAFDSARDNNSRSLMPVMLCGSNQKLLVAIPRPDGPKHAGWIARVLGTILDCTYDVGAQELASSSTGRALSAGNAASILNEIANFVGPYVWMVCSDHASPEIKAMKNLQVSHAVLACGDPSHAAHNLAKYLITPFQGFIDLVNDVANFFRNHGEAKTWLQTKLKEQEGGKANAFTIMQNNVETRFLSVFYMLQSFLRALPALKDVVNVSEWVTWTTKTF
jgi:hypothetical protein